MCFNTFLASLSLLGGGLPRSCELYPEDDGAVPESLKVLDGQEYGFELDGWVRWDMPTDDYYDLFANNEVL